MNTDWEILYLLKRYLCDNIGWENTFCDKWTTIQNGFKFESYNNIHITYQTTRSVDYTIHYTIQAYVIFICKCVRNRDSILKI